MRRLRSYAWFVIGVIALAGVSLVVIGDGDVDAPTDTAAAPSTVESRGWKVTFVADGDTLDVIGSEGRETVRLAGVNAPEEGECGADEARRDLREIAGASELVLVRDETDRDSFGRLVRFVETTEGVDLGAAMVQRGWALSRRYWPDTSRNDAYDELQVAARAAGLGQWASDTCGAPVPGVAVNVEIHADAAGRDDQNLLDEWVRFTNIGATPLDLAGWTVADESATNRFAFEALVLAPGASVTLVTGCGTDDAVTRHWCTDSFPIWNNEGDTVFLRDPEGRDVLAVDY